MAGRIDARRRSVRFGQDLDRVALHLQGCRDGPARPHRRPPGEPHAARAHRQRIRLVARPRRRTRDVPQPGRHVPRRVGLRAPSGGGGARDPPDPHRQPGGPPRDRQRRDPVPRVRLLVAPTDRPRRDRRVHDAGGRRTLRGDAPVRVRDLAPVGQRPPPAVPAGRVPDQARAHRAEDPREQPRPSHPRIRDHVERHRARRPVRRRSVLRVAGSLTSGGVAGEFPARVSRDRGLLPTAEPPAGHEEKPRHERGIEQERPLSWRARITGGAEHRGCESDLSRPRPAGCGSHDRSRFGIACAGETQPVGRAPWSRGGRHGSR